MKKVTQEDMNTIWSGSGTLVERQSVYNRIVNSINEMEQCIEELEEEAELQLNKARHYFKKLKRIEELVKAIYKLAFVSMHDKDKAKALNNIRNVFIENDIHKNGSTLNYLIKSILEEGVDQDENN